MRDCANILLIYSLCHCYIALNRRSCCGAIIPLSVSFFPSPLLYSNRHPLFCLCHSASSSGKKKIAVARGREEEMIRSIFFSGNRPPDLDSLPHSCCLCSSFYNWLVWPHLWSFVANLISLISGHTQHVMENVTISTCSSYTMGGDVDDRDTNKA